MILVVLAALCLATVPVTGGQLRLLGRLRLRCLWLAPLALVVQVVIISVASRGAPTVHALLHIATYALGAAFLWINRRTPGMPVIGAGALANTAAIAANAGVMPASATAERIAGLRLGAGFQNSAHLAHAHLAWLGDIIPVPALGPLSNVLSVGDLLIYAGLLVLLHRACRGHRVGARAAASAQAPAASPPAAGHTAPA